MLLTGSATNSLKLCICVVNCELNCDCLLFAETSDAGAPTGGGTANEKAEPKRRDATANGDSVHRERAPDERDRHLERNYQGEPCSAAARRSITVCLSARHASSRQTHGSHSPAF
jgi:hypothetical protein